MMTTGKHDFQEVNQVLRSTWLINYINNRIYILKLSSHLSGEDIIQHVTECLIRDLKSGKKIEYPIAWAKLVSERYISKVYKKNRKTEATEAEKIEYFANLVLEETSFPYLDHNRQLHQSIQQLKPSSRQLIEMRFFQQMHWNKIAEILSCQENKLICIATARKRGERALNELRQIYLTL
jgi:RNA polymerase sigma factor (sigma-70 family)